MSENREREAEVQHALSQSPPEAEPQADLARVFREHHQRVYRAAYRITGNSQDAEDVLQTVFLRLARREGGSPLSDSPGHYLHRAAVNAALDTIRSRKAARTTSLEVVEPAMADGPERGPDKAQESKEIRHRIRQALATASPKSAEIFILRYFEGYDNHEIASMLGTSRSTVNVILHRTRKKLREEIGPPVGDTP